MDVPALRDDRDEGASQVNVGARLYRLGFKVVDPAANWEACPGCDNPWCHLHGAHAFECACPEVGAGAKHVVKDGEVVFTGTLLEAKDWLRKTGRIGGVDGD